MALNYTGGNTLPQADAHLTTGRSIVRAERFGPLAAVLVLLTPFSGHAVPLTGAILAALVAVKLAMLVFFAVVFGPGVFCNALFHIGASVRFRAYCPGTATALAVYLPLAGTLGALAVGDGLMSGRSLLVAMAIAPIVHTIEVCHNVFKKW